MSRPKPRIRPKGEPDPGQSQQPPRDPPSHPEQDPPVFTERDPQTERKASDRVVFHEDDCLR